MVSVLNKIGYTVLAKFTFVCLMGLATSWLFQYLLITDTLYYEALADQLSYSRINSFIRQTKEWAWLNKALMPVLYGIKLTLVASTIALGSYLATNKFQGLLIKQLPLS